MVRQQELKVTLNITIMTVAITVQRVCAPFSLPRGAEGGVPTTKWTPVRCRASCT